MTATASFSCAKRRAACGARLEEPSIPKRFRLTPSFVKFGRKPVSIRSRFVFSASTGARPAWSRIRMAIARYVVTVFECAVLGGTLRERSDETNAAAFVSASELEAYEISGWVRHVVPGLYDRSRTAFFEAPSWQPPLTGAA